MEPEDISWLVIAKKPDGRLVSELIETNDPKNALDIFIEAESWRLGDGETFTFLKIINFYEMENKNG